MTLTAYRDAFRLGFDRAGVASTISGIGRHMFYKSMTTFANHRIWQDVYHVSVGDMVLYIKFQADVVTEFTVISFKEKS
jgi:motility quorum-sensing regulator/GCU-specific mRNA interferase toxin